MFCTITSAQAQPVAVKQSASLRFVEIIKTLANTTHPILEAFIGQNTITLKRPVAAAIRNNELFIADAELGLLIRYDLSRRDSAVLYGAGDKALGEISDVFVMQDGQSVFVTDTLGKRVLWFDRQGNLKKVIKHGPNISRPIAISVNESAKEIYVADEVYSHIVVFDYNGKPIRGMGGRGEGEGKFRIITDMIPDGDGFLVSDRIEFSVQSLDAAGRYVSHFGDEHLMFPTAIAKDQFGRIFVSDKGDSRIKVFKDGQLLEDIGRNGYGEGEFRYISDMKIANDKLYVMDSLNGRIQVFDIQAPRTAKAVSDKSVKVGLFQ
ncbi:MAG: 6-bladed beta-propeller [Gammaproteobacteria bacterium]|nr:6-bladed beta-propeller [Gammaproteobacteria bacterium]MDH5729244.1 6-bladed beta-propeller [Gammaproteobacteria bacterium]